MIIYNQNSVKQKLGSSFFVVRAQPGQGKRNSFFFFSFCSSPPKARTEIIIKGNLAKQKLLPNQHLFKNTAP